MVFISSGENHGCALLSVQASGDESFGVKEAWTPFGASSVSRCEWPTPLLLDGRLFGLDSVGGAGPLTHYTCVDIATGRGLWQAARFGKGNAIAADGKLFARTLKGELVLMRASADGFAALGRKKALGPTRQAPALANARLCLRDDREIVCLDVARAR